MQVQMWKFVCGVFILCSVNGMWLDDIYQKPDNIYQKPDNIHQKPDIYQKKDDNWNEGNILEPTSILKHNFKYEETIRELFHRYSTNKNLINYCCRPSNCAELYYSGAKDSGVYKIYPKSWFRKKEFEVYCDMKTDGGGWTVIQRRGKFRDPGINFTRAWTDYEIGFGNLLEEFWLGNAKIHLLSSQEHTVLRFDMEDFEGNTRYAQYDGFEVADATDKYRLKIGKYSGDAGEGLYVFHQNKTFVTWDEYDSINCAKKYRGGWWYGSCHTVNPNGEYQNGANSAYGKGILWNPWKGYYYSLKAIDMKIRPKLFTNMLEK